MLDNKLIRSLAINNYMDKEIDKKKVFWLIFLILLFPCVFKSFVVNINKVTTSIKTYNDYRLLINDLNKENHKLEKDISYYSSKEGIKTLVKEQLYRVENGESIYRFKQSKSVNE